MLKIVLVLGLLSTQALSGPYQGRFQRPYRRYNIDNDDQHFESIVKHFFLQIFSIQNSFNVWILDPKFPQVAQQPKKGQDPGYITVKYIGGEDELRRRPFMVKNILSLTNQMELL